MTSDAGSDACPVPRGAYPVPRGAHRVEEVVRRSRFVTTLDRARDADSARAVIALVRSELPGATHHCWAFVAGAPGSTRAIGMSDAGEPPGTAGRPMLNVLLGGGVGEVVAVCARWFGGAKLGRGGLARAYASGVKKALEGLQTEVLVARELVGLIVPYAAVDPLRRVLDDLDARTVREEYGSDVSWELSVPSAGLEALDEAVAQITAGEASVRRLGGG